MLYIFSGFVNFQMTHNFNKTLFEPGKFTLAYIERLIRMYIFPLSLDEWRCTQVGVAVD